MTDISTLIIALASLAGVALTILTGLRAFDRWLAYRQAELDATTRPTEFNPGANTRIEIADLKERVRKLEAIAAGVDL